MQITYVILLAFAYLCGSIPFGVLIARSRGVDIRRRGSGNIGFSNVRRVLGWRDGIMTLFGDTLKGLVPSLIAFLITHDLALTLGVGIAAVIGHICSPWLGFKGGKGVATSLGAVVLVAPLAVLCGILVYIGCHVIGSKSSTASMLGIIISYIVAMTTVPYLSLYLLGLTGLLFWALRKNILGTVPDYG